MRFDPPPPIAAMILAAGLAQPAQAQVAKHAPVRHGYDFTRPEPGEILPNPTEGIGAAPQLRAYTDAKEMTTRTTSGQSAPIATATGNIPGQAMVVVPESSLKRSSAQDRASTAPAPETAGQSLSQTARIARHIQATLGQEVVALGLEGPFEYHPSAAAQNDPELRVSEKRAWDIVVDSLASSWRDWQASHPKDDARQPVAPSPVVASPADRRELALSRTSAHTDTAEGRIVLTGAPPKVTGDLPDGSP